MLAYVTCPRCNAALPPGTRYCSNCNSAVLSSVDTATDAHSAPVNWSGLGGGHTIGFGAIFGIVAFLGFCILTTASNRSYSSSYDYDEGYGYPTAGHIITPEIAIETAAMQFVQKSGGAFPATDPKADMVAQLTPYIQGSNTPTFLKELEWNYRLSRKLQTDVVSPSEVWLFHARNPSYDGLYGIGFADGSSRQFTLSEINAAISKPTTFLSQGG